MSKKHNNIESTTGNVATDPLNDEDKIAITGIGCRYGGGVSGPRELWDMLKEQRDCTSSHPTERFDKSTFFYPGEKKKAKLYTKAGGYLKQDPLMFDRQFFKMSPDEAGHMDPQIRILLEVVWESIEDAGIPASNLRGSNTGVYMGVTANEYLSLIGLPQSNIGQYSNSGTNSCMISNRISYEFDLHGPSFSIDTACSSSLYAVQVACDALRGGVCDTAIAGGVNIILTPSVTIGFCQAGMLSPDGQCKSFDESANGYSRSEGVGSVVLKPLKRAMEDGDRIYAVIRGGALTNDGRTPGIVNPSFDAQIDLVHRACAAAKVDPRNVAYIEAHGTGTPVGDKTEANAIGQAMSKQRSDDNPLYIGSIKSNVGHSEGAAGIAGIIKTALSLYHRKIPGNVHFRNGNPEINFKELKLRVPTSLTPWPVGSQLLAGCSSFGFGGANAHIVLEASLSKQNCIKPDNENLHTSMGPYIMLLLSAQSLNALEQRVVEFKNFLSDLESEALQNVLYTANMRTHKHEQRAFFIAKSVDELLMLFEKRINGERSDSVIEGKAPGNSVIRTVFVFSGMGTQWWGMARELMSTQPVFSKTIEVIDDYLRRNGARWSLIQMLSDETDKDRINNDTEISQTCICSVQIGLVELYKYYGVTPSAIIGHSVGEVAAAYAAGLISMAAAVKIIFRRGNLLRKTIGSGTMAAVLHDVEDIKTRLKSSVRYIDIAAINSPMQIVLSGKTDIINQFSSELNGDGIQTKALKVNNAFHSRQQEILKEEFLKKTRFLKKNKHEQRPLIPMMSTVTNRYLTLQEANSPDYWWSNVRRQVRFKDAVESLLKDGYNSFLEIGAHPALSPAIKDIIASKQNSPTIHFIAQSLRRPRDISSPTTDVLNFNISLAQLCVNGFPIDMKPFYQGHKCEVESLPLYPWQRVECSATTDIADVTMRYPNNFHPLLGEPETSANYSKNTRLRVWKANIGTHNEPWIADHVVQGSVVLPAAGFIETAIAAHNKLFTDTHHVFITHLHFDRFLFVSENGTQVETTTEMTSDETSEFKFHSFNERENKWTQHSTMNLHKDAFEIGEHMHLHLNEIMSRCPQQLDKHSFYANKKEVGFNLGKSFECIELANHSTVVDEALIYLRSPDTVAAQSSRFYIHPAFLDGILQSMAGLERLRDKILNPGKRPDGRVPRSIENVYFKKCAFPDTVYLHFIITGNGDDVYADVYVADAKTLNIIGKFTKICFGSVAGRGESVKLNSWEKKWVPIEIGQKPFDATGLTVIAGDDHDLSCQLMNTLGSVGLNSKIDGTSELTTDEIEALSNVIIVMKPFNKDTNHYDLSFEDFLEQQANVAEICTNYYKTLSTMTDANPNVWLVTRDGFYVTNDDQVDPNQASACGFGYCVMQEDLNFKLSMIDLPSDIHAVIAADWLLKYIWGSDNDESIIALRQSSAFLTSEEFNVYTTRIHVTESRYFPYKQMSSKWKFQIDQSVQTGRLSLTAHNATERENETELTSVDIESFKLIKPSKKTSSGEVQPVALFCAHSDEDIVMGVCSSKELKNPMMCEKESLIKIECKLPRAQIINIVTSYFVPFMVVRDLKPDGITVVCMSSSDDKQSLAVSHIALKLGHSVVLAIKDLPTEHGITLNSADSSKIVNGKGIVNFLKEESVGCLIGRADYVRELLRYEGMVGKLKPFATIEIVSCHKDGYQNNNFDLQINARVVIKNYELPLLGGFQQIKHPLNSLLRLFETPSSLLHLKDIASRNICLKEVKSHEIIPFSDVTFIVDNEAFPVNYDFFVNEIRFSIDEAYIVTGGTQGFGLCLVEWLANNGAGRIFILSRSLPDTEAQMRLDSLVKCGTEIFHIKTDITSRDDVERAFEIVLNDSTKALSGVFHCAAQYDDKLIKEMTPESWKNVMGVKSWGALLLHQTSIKLKVPLKYFVMISSVVQFAGNTGQASYCAANNYLGSLGHVRRSQGLPATVFCPGVIEDTGFAARKGLVNFWERKGIDGLTAIQALKGLSVVLLSSAPEIGISGEFRVNDYIAQHRGLIKELISNIDEVGIIKLGFSTERSIEEGRSYSSHLKPEEAKLAVFQAICGFIAKRVGLTGEISPDSSPASLGIDSLMSTELSGDIQRKFSIAFSPMELMNVNVTIQTLSTLIYKRIVAKFRLGGKESNDETDAGEDTSWKAWYILDQSVTSPTIQIVCFPPNGGGPSAYAWWQNHFGKHNVQLIMAQLPGWEGRHLEKPLQTIEEIVRHLTDYLAPRLIPGRFVLFGHSLGGLIAFKVAHRLIEQNLQPAHMIISSWYAPTLEYPDAIELDNAPSILRQMEQNINNNIQLTDDKSLRLSFVDDELLGNTELMKRLIPCFRVGFKICKTHRNTHEKKLPCGMTVFGAKSDRFIPVSTLDAWSLEIDANQSFKKILVPGGHMHITRAKKKFFQKIQNALSDALNSQFSSS